MPQNCTLENGYNGKCNDIYLHHNFFKSLGRTHSLLPITLSLLLCEDSVPSAASQHPAFHFFIILANLADFKPFFCGFLPSSTWHTPRSWVQESIWEMSF